MASHYRKHVREGICTERKEKGRLCWIPINNIGSSKESEMSKSSSENKKKIYIVEGCCGCPNENFMRCDEIDMAVNEYFKHGSPDFHSDCPLENYEERKVK